MVRDDVKRDAHAYSVRKVKLSTLSRPGANMELDLKRVTKKADATSE